MTKEIPKIKTIHSINILLPPNFDVILSEAPSLMFYSMDFNFSYVAD